MNSVSNKAVSIGVTAGLCVILMTPVSSVQAASIDQRLQRLERMVENPVLLQLSRRLGEQQREIQSLEDEIDRLKRNNQLLKQKFDKRFSETDERINALEGGEVVGRPASDTVNALSIDDSQPIGTGHLKAVTDTATTIIAPAVTSLPHSVAKQASQTAKSEAANNADSSTENTAAGANESAADSDELDEGKKPVTTAVSKVRSAVISTHLPTGIEKIEYQKAFKLMKASKYRDAIKGFKLFLEHHPESELASNSAYWAGEGYLIQDKNKEALAMFQLVIDRYSHSSKVPDAQLRAGDTFMRLNRLQEAKEMYKTLIKARPSSRAAKNAIKRLKEI